jgi:hypothetical protein
VLVAVGVTVGAVGETAAGPSVADPVAALDRCPELVAQHRFAEVASLLSPFEGAELPPELGFAVAVELGRARFHTGDYAGADRSFRAAVRVHPEQVEPALYLQATSYLLGREEQAFAIFRAILASGAHDLHLAVSLPGESRFLAEPEVWRALAAAARPLPVGVRTGTAFGVALGEPRATVVAALGAGADTADAPAITSHAGPHSLWALAFAADGRLAEVVVDAENVVRYTPLRLALDGGLDWRSSPASCVAVLGPPADERPTADGRQLSWRGDGHTATLAFGPSRQPAPPGLEDPAAMLKLVRLVRRPS